MNAIEVSNVKKSFKIYYDKGRTLKEKILYADRNKYEKREVLSGISFYVKKGEAVGLIGQNGCGKSTTLKLLTRIIYPDAGTVKLNGRVSSLLELGAGFHPDMSGRENIYINASIFGLSRKEIDRKMGDIIGFSELEEFIDNPVRTYSSGMYMRLAFSVAINVDADILLIDEILAVGDVNFQAKCFRKMQEIKNKGTSIVLVSHSMEQMEQICDRGIWLHKGKIRMEGTTKEIGREYLRYMGVEAGDVCADNERAEERFGTGEARFQLVRSRNLQGEETTVYRSGEPIQFDLEYKVYHELKYAVFGLSIFRSDGIRCYGTNTRVDGIPAYHLVRDGKISIIFDDMRLLPAKYDIDVCIEKEENDFADYQSHLNAFEVVSEEKDIGVMKMPHNWKMTEETS
uniref:ABC transporter domain-containing protein n=1 Tax=Eubacterium plexicaudatum ASF492 TaxID=1235802 RepID=N2ACS8_9FIRM